MHLFYYALAVAGIDRYHAQVFIIHSSLQRKEPIMPYASILRSTLNSLQLRSLRLFLFSVPPASGCFLPILQTAFDALLCCACRLHSADKFICCFKLLPPRLRGLGRAVRKRIYPPQESTLWAHKIPKSFLKTLF